MGLYRMARPLVFLVPPEAAHRILGFLMSLPLPWRALGGGRGLPAVPAELAGIPLRNPVGLAAGYDKDARYLRGLEGLGFGYLVVGTVTRRARRGNPRPRVVRLPERGSLVNAMGLPNRGAAAAAERLRRFRPSVPVLASLADEALEDVLAGHTALEPHVDGFEVNASCPNVSWGRDADTETHLRALLEALRPRSAKPILVKLPPFAGEREREAVLALARVARDAGADGLTCSNTRPVPEARLAVGRGGLSGRALYAETPRIVAEVHRAVEGAVPVNACGGVTTAADAAACLEAGAATVQLYTAMVFEGPRVVRRIVEGLAASGAGGRNPLDAPAGSSPAA